MWCCFCDIKVDPEDPKSFHEVTVWVSGPKKDGAVLRSATGRIACRKCISDIRAGAEPGSPDLFAMVQVDNPHTEVDRSDPDYEVGWKNGFQGYDIHNLGDSQAYNDGFAAGSKLRDYLDGYFFWEITG